MNKSAQVRELVKGQQQCIKLHILIFSVSILLVILFAVVGNEFGIAPFTKLCTSLISSISSAANLYCIIDRFNKISCLKVLQLQFEDAETNAGDRSEVAISNRLFYGFLSNSLKLKSTNSEVKYEK